MRAPRRTRARPRPRTGRRSAHPPAARCRSRACPPRGIPGSASGCCGCAGSRRRASGRPGSPATRR
ncbi:hypothetical protein FNH07_14840 [Amycolatopsis bartoniae]|nr:hypothetical protein FNH07_14840 [Amycolatopsis bartoniae]